jgi:hypothetical protein
VEIEDKGLGKEMMPKLLGGFCCCCLLSSIAIAGGRPCWDDVPPAVKYKNQHVITGNDAVPPWTHSLNFDGLQVLAKLTKVPSGILVEVMVMNCSSMSIHVYPNTFDLTAVEPNNDKILTHLDPTRFRHPNGNAYLPLRDGILQYGQSETYQLFFAPDSDFANVAHRLSCGVGNGQWRFVFYFLNR